MVNRMRSTRSHRNNRRSHFALTLPRISLCEHCKGPRLSHSACMQCGKYRGHTAFDLSAKIDKKLRRQKEKEKAGVK